MEISLLVSRVRSKARGWVATPTELDDRNIRLLYIDIAWQGIVAAGTGTFLSVFLARMGASSLIISWLTALPALVTFFVSLPASAYVESRHNHVRITTIFRLLFRSMYLFPVVLPFFLYDSFPRVIVILWGIQAIPMAVAVVSWTSVISAVVPTRRRPAVMGGRWALLSIVTAVFVALFGKLLDAPWLRFPTNYQLVFLISAVSAVLGTVYFDKIVMQADYCLDRPERPPLLQQVKNLLRPMVRTPAFTKYLGATFPIRLGMAMPTALYSIFWVNDLQASDTLIGLRTTLAQVALVIAYFLLGRLAARRGVRGILLASAVGLGLYPVLTAISPTPIWLLPVAILQGIFSGGITIAFFEGLLNTTPREKVPTFTAVNAMFANLAAFVGPLLGAVLMEGLGIRMAFLIAGGFHVAGAVLCWRMKIGVVK
jgi:MFS family permease